MSVWDERTQKSTRTIISFCLSLQIDVYLFAWQMPAVSGYNQTRLKVWCRRSYSFLTNEVKRFKYSTVDHLNFARNWRFNKPVNKQTNKRTKLATFLFICQVSRVFFCLFDFFSWNYEQFFFARHCQHRFPPRIKFERIKSICLPRVWSHLLLILLVCLG